MYGGYTSFSTGGSLLPGDSVTYECVEGYVMTSQSSVITCGSDGDWSDLPACSRIDTGPAPTAAPVKGEKPLLLPVGVMADGHRCLCARKGRGEAKHSMKALTWRVASLLCC